MKGTITKQLCSRHTWIQGQIITKLICIQHKLVMIQIIHKKPYKYLPKIWKSSLAYEPTANGAVNINGVPKLILNDIVTYSMFVLEPEWPGRNNWTMFLTGWMNFFFCELLLHYYLMGNYRPSVQFAMWKIWKWN